MNQQDDLLSVLKELTVKVGELVVAVKELVEIQKETKKKPSKAQNSLSEASKEELKSKFQELYEKWASGKEFEVKKILEDMTLSDLRGLGDAGNAINNKKASKEKVLESFVTRFREMKMLRIGIVP